MEEDLGRVQGWAGWSPVPAIADRGDDKVMVIADFVGGEDNKPTSEIGKYVGVDGLVADIEDAVALPKGATGEKPKMNSTSITSNVIGTGTKTFILATPMDLVVGQVAKAYSLADPNNYVCGFIFSITPTEIVITVSEIGGTGTKTDWVIVSSAFRGEIGISTTNMTVANRILGLGSDDSTPQSPKQIEPIGFTLLGGKLYNGNYKVMESLRIANWNNPKDGLLLSWNTPRTGAIRIEIPSISSTTMFITGSIWREGNLSNAFKISAYPSSMSGTTSAIFIGAISYPVRWYTDGVKRYIYIGDTTTSWGLSVVSIDKVQSGITNPISVATTGFIITYETSFVGTLNAIRTASQTLPNSNLYQIVSDYVAASGIDTPLTNAMSILQMFQNLQKQILSRIVNTGSALNLILGNGTSKPVSDFILASQKGAANGVVPLNASTLIDQVYLPSYVDDIIEGYKSGANFYKEVGLTTLITGETGKIYVDLTTGQNSKQYRWSGSAYIQITNGLIASTNDVPEGGSNLYFTVARVLATVISGFSAAAGVVANTDTILQAINKIVGNITAVNTALALKADIAASTGTLVALTFTSDSVQGTIASPLTGNITGNITGAKLGVVTLVIHNHTTAPTFDSKYKKLSGSGSYVTGSINYIFCEYINDTEIIYSINQRT